MLKGSSCFSIELEPETESKDNLQEFFIVAECVHPDPIPVEKAMWPPINEDAPSQLCLRYKAMIDIIDVVDLRPTPVAPPHLLLTDLRLRPLALRLRVVSRPVIQGPRRFAPKRGVARARHLAATPPLSSLVEGSQLRGRRCWTVAYSHDYLGGAHFDA
jgi:hypothetical protein